MNLNMRNKPLSVLLLRDEQENKDLEDRMLVV